jgi:hypothetical protein
MCIFDGNIDNVSGTKIFTSIVYPAKLISKNVNGMTKGYKMPVGNPLQMVIYSNNVQIAYMDKYTDVDVPGIRIPSTAMILPFPLIKGENRVKILDMSKYENFFDDIDMVFPTLKNSGFRGMLSTNDGELPVQHIGNYKASIVPNLNSFDKLQYNEFNLKPDVKELLRKYYSNGYGFMVCILNKKSSRESQFHPFAYVHEIRSDGRIFIPTRHYHKKTVSNPYSRYHNPVDEINTNHDDNDNNDNDEVSEVSNYIYGTLMIDDKWMKLTSKKHDLQSYREKTEIDWDHEIYVVNFPRLLKNSLLQKPGVRITNGDLNKLVNFYTYVEASKLPREIVLTKPVSLFKIKIDGNYKYNHDFYL